MFVACWALASWGEAHGSIVFNEIYADPSEDASCDGGLDSTGDEFVELVNLGPGAVDLSGATLSDAVAVRHTFGPLVLGEGEALVVFGGDPAVFDGSGPHPWCVDAGPTVAVVQAGGLGLNNSGDDLILAAADGTVLASVSYPATADDDQSLVLSPELYGSGYVKHLTVSAHTSSPGRTAGGGLLDPGADPGCSVASGAGVVINEIFADAPGADAGLEWIELLGGAEPTDLSGWRLAAGASAYTEGLPLPAGLQLLPGEHLVIGPAPLEPVHVVADLPTLGNASTSADAVQLLDCLGAVVDTVVYGEPNSDGWLDDQGLIASSLAPPPPEGGSLARVPDGVDTDQSGGDLVAVAWPTPGESNASAPGGCGGPGSGVVINELLPNPEGADAGAEWVELFHGGTEPVQLEGWVLQAGTSSFEPVHTFGPLWLEPTGRLWLGGDAVVGADPAPALALGNGSNADGVRLVDCAGLPVDTVIYGSPNDGDPPFVDDTEQIAQSLAPTPGEGASLQRVADGVDTDQSALDWVIAEQPSPGAPNPEHALSACEQGGAITINEILPDPQGEDTDAEWVELHNHGEAEASVAGWALSVGTSGFAEPQIVLGGGLVVPAQGFLVIGGAAVPGADVVAPLSLGNGTGTDGIRLYDCAGEAIDTVLYGPSPNEDELSDDLGEVVEPYGAPTSGASLARIHDGVDTDAAADWSVATRPSPGASNARTLTPGAVPERGCAGGQASQPPPPGAAPEAREPAGGCHTAAAGASLLALVPLALLRRRRSATR